MKMEIEYLRGLFPNLQWYSWSHDVITTDWRGVRIFKGSDGYYLSLKNDYNLYKFRSIQDLGEQLERLSKYSQLVLSI